MPQSFKEKRGGVGTGIIGGNSVQFSVADAVNIKTTGLLGLVAAAGERIRGFSIDQRTMSATNSTVALICPQYLDAVNCVMIYGADGTIALEDIGEYKDFGTVTTGAFQVANAGSGESTTGTTTAQLVCLDRDPDKDGTNTTGVYKAAQPDEVATGAV